MNSNAKKPVVIYGASGYTGQLMAEYFRDFGIPFTAAGRDAKRVEEAMKRVPGIETADFDVAGVDTSVEALQELFEGRVVVCNVVGPFITLGPTVVEAALKAKVHYIDTTGEQASILDVRNNWGEKFAEIDRVAAPSTAYMYAPCEIATRMVLESGGIDSVEGITLFQGIPTYTSTQSIYVQLRAQPYYLENNELVPWQKGVGHEVQLPGSHESHLALPWGGTGGPVWMQDEPSVRNARYFGGVINRPMMEGVLAMEQDFEENIRPLPVEQQEEELAKRASDVQQSMPPRENPLEHRTVDSVQGRGSLNAAQVVLFGNCAYKQTAVIQAVAVNHLLNSRPEKVGFASPCSAFGYKEMYAKLEAYGLSRAQRVL